MAPRPEATPTSSTTPEQDGFHVTLANFSGPFDLLLTLIGQRELDITDVALAAITDEFIGYVRALRGEDSDGGAHAQALDEMSEFLVVAATLLDLKAARLLPGGAVDDEADLALLEARDLLFARLLQYRAYKRISHIFAELIRDMEAYVPRQTGPDIDTGPQPTPIRWSHKVEEFAALAREVFDRPILTPPQVGLEHIHAPAVSVREQAELLIQRLTRHGRASWSELVADAAETLIVVGRFLAVLDLYRAGVVAFEQPHPLGEVTIQWCGGDQRWKATELTDD